MDYNLVTEFIYLWLSYSLHNYAYVAQIWGMKICKKVLLLEKDNMPIQWEDVV